MTANISENRTFADPNAGAAIQLFGGRDGFDRTLNQVQRLSKLGIWKIYIFSNLWSKRVLDISLSIAALLILSPILLTTALLIWLEDRGHPLFVQERVGVDGRTFKMFKFRSMSVNADRLKHQLHEQNESSAGVVFKIKRDPRITRIGRIIRKLSIDELPQFYNVLRGDMSLVGPRPPVPKEVSQYSQRQRARLSVKPGITCFWQVNGRSDIDFLGQVKLDLEYIRQQSTLLDLRLLLRTIPAVLFGKGAY